MINHFSPKPPYRQKLPFSHFQNFLPKGSSNNSFIPLSYQASSIFMMTVNCFTSSNLWTKVWLFVRESVIQWETNRPEFWPPRIFLLLTTSALSDIGSSCTKSRILIHKKILHLLFFGWHCLCLVISVYCEKNAAYCRKINHPFFAWSLKENNFFEVHL